LSATRNGRADKGQSVPALRQIPATTFATVTPVHGRICPKLHRRLLQNSSGKVAKVSSAAFGKKGNATAIAAFQRCDSVFWQPSICAIAAKWVRIVAS